MAEASAATDPLFEELVEIKESPNKGLGVFAIVDIKAGTNILMEPPLLRVEYGVYTRNVRLEPEIAAFDALSEEEKQQYLGLYARADAQQVAEVGEDLRKPRPDGSVFTDEQIELYTRVDAIFFSNDFAMPGRGAYRVDGVFPRASRFNHSCDPNAVYSNDWQPGYWLARASRNIKAGDEVTIPYIPIVASRERRQITLSSGWGFQCLCDMCEGNEDYEKELEEALASLDIVPTESDRRWVFEDEEVEALSQQLDRRLRLCLDLKLIPQIYFE
ncbi:hypothetical protein F4779DRAFT_609683 [Xylariaceae sp. FL0662B]|nr:hypothetical protein F4779DRAFT_609683 [Xylariaceae sp. FL0662B]